MEVDSEKTEARRQEIRQGRLKHGERLISQPDKRKLDPSEIKETLMRIHEYLELVEKKDGTKTICCAKCGNEFCSPSDNYKKYTLRWTRDIRELKKVMEGQEPITYYQEYICPGCGTLLEVDTWCPLIDDDEPLWDIHIKL